MNNWEQGKLDPRYSDKIYGPPGTLDGAQTQLGRIALPNLVEKFSVAYQNSCEIVSKLENQLYRLTGEPGDPRVERANTPDKGIQSPLHQLNDLANMIDHNHSRAMKLLYQLGELL